uniref:Uncharacterized protein n=1 Tax=Rhodococcoides fascians D188 TaxID=1051973 RepID=G8JYZ5_RHOFA|nr:hypothetical protein pFi_130 [Rhodococcus fascians D188]
MPLFGRSLMLDGVVHYGFPCSGTVRLWLRTCLSTRLVSSPPEAVTSGIIASGSSATSLRSGGGSSQPQMRVRRFSLHRSTARTRSIYR